MQIIVRHTLSFSSGTLPLPMWGIAYLACTSIYFLTLYSFTQLNWIHSWIWIQDDWEIDPRVQLGHMSCIVQAKEELEDASADSKLCCLFMECLHSLSDWFNPLLKAMERSLSCTSYVQARPPKATVSMSTSDVWDIIHTYIHMYIHIYRY
jgi:hypothetical protein